MFEADCVAGSRKAGSERHEAEIVAQSARRRAAGALHEPGACDSSSPAEWRRQKDQVALWELPASFQGGLGGGGKIHEGKTSWRARSCRGNAARQSLTFKRPTTAPRASGSTV